MLSGSQEAAADQEVEDILAGRQERLLNTALHCTVNISHIHRGHYLGSYTCFNSNLFQCSVQSCAMMSSQSGLVIVILTNQDIFRTFIVSGLVYFCSRKLSILQDDLFVKYSK